MSCFNDKLDETFSRYIYHGSLKFEYLDDSPTDKRLSPLLMEFFLSTNTFIFFSIR